MTRLAVLGDCLLDRDWIGRTERLCPDSAGPVVDVDDEVLRVGGAGLAAIAAAELGATVTFFTALSGDGAGDWLRASLAEHGVSVQDFGLCAPTPEKIRLRTEHGTVSRIDRHCRPTGSIRPVPAPVLALDRFDGVLVSDYGRGVASLPAVRTALGAVARRVPVVWDPHPLGPRPVGGVRLATPSMSDLAAIVRNLASTTSTTTVTAAAAARAARTAWRCPVVVTAGRHGAVYFDREPVVVPATPLQGDANGAGDCFAAGVAVALASGAAVTEAISEGVAAGARHVRGQRTPDVLFSLQRASSSGQRVIATSGCFDIIHSGHLALLRFARSLGDRLVVCLNSDRSVRRLKGDPRPFTPEHERAELLGSLSFVDDVLIFDEATPAEVLRRFRPAVFVKGGDYDGRRLPEHAVLAEWGGEVAFGPLVPDRSTTRLLAIAQQEAG